MEEKELFSPGFEILINALIPMAEDSKMSYGVTYFDGDHLWWSAQGYILGRLGSKYTPQRMREEAFLRLILDAYQ